jgi:predicted metal-dependent hydrolase
VLNFDQPAELAWAPAAAPTASGASQDPEAGHAAPVAESAPDVTGGERTPPVVVRRSARRKRTVTAYREAGTIVVLIPQRMSKTDEQKWVSDMVAKVVAREQKRKVSADDGALARRAIELSQRYLQPALGYVPTPTSVHWVTNQNQRWGSCTPTTGAIRLSHRMLPMPSWVTDYVLLHELTHLTEHRHSPRFWGLVRAYPHAEKAEGYLEGYLAGQAQQPAS